MFVSDHWLWLHPGHLVAGLVGYSGEGEPPQHYCCHLSILDGGYYCPNPNFAQGQTTEAVDNTSLILAGATYLNLNLLINE